MKILFAMRDLQIGGVQKGLVNLLNKINEDKKYSNIEIDLLVMKKIGPLEADLPKNIHIIEAIKPFWKFGISQVDSKKFGILFKFKRSIAAIICKIFGNKILIKNALKKQPLLDGYDLAISYSISISNKSLYAGWSELILQKVCAKKKIVFIHNDFIASSLNNSYCLKLLEDFDKIIFVSKSCMNSFIQDYGQSKDKCDYVYNIVENKQIKEKSEKSQISFDKNKFNIVSVSRLSKEKGFDRSLRIFKKLKDERYNFIWHILGDGPMKNYIETFIKNNKLENYVKLYGNQNNPYPYIKRADLFYLGSYHESFGIVLIEAMLLGVVPLTTKTISASEVVGKFGFVCENNEQAIFECLKRILNSKKTLTIKQQMLLNYSYNNELAKNQFINLLDMNNY